MKLVDSYLSVRNLTTDYCKPLSIEDYIPQVEEFASPPLWHLAHTTWFFEEMILKTYLSGYEVFDERFNYLFNSYYNSVGERNQRNKRGAITRPGVERVYQYRDYVDKGILKLINKNGSEAIKELIILGMNHEQQHQELLLTDLKLAFYYNPFYPVYKEDFIDEQAIEPASNWINIKEGIYDIGFKGEGFFFDNEKGNHKVYLHDYSISSGLVTNKEYLEFMEAGGYEKPAYWLDEGWSWLNQNRIKAPMYWKGKEGVWYQYTLSGMLQLEKEAPVSHISFYEANAYANWKGLRLATEFEWEVAARQINWGTRWEWTNSAYLPYPGFSIAEGAVGEYNGKFMVNQMVLRGKSIMTSAGHSRLSYRNFFPANTRWQFSGIRLAK